MGLAKQEAVRREGRGLPIDSYAEGYVCSRCFANPFIQQFVSGEATELVCDFCGQQRDHPIAADLDEVIGFINDGLMRKYEALEDGNVPYDSEEGGYLMGGDSTDDLVLSELDLPLDDSGRLSDAITRGLGAYRSWVRNGGISMNAGEYYSHSWNQFCCDIKHRVRFFFRESKQESDDPYLMSTANMLDRIPGICDRFNLFDILPEGSTVFRAREEDQEGPWTEPCDLGPPPAKKAKFENRMSPVGIPMFYGSGDVETCIVETVGKPCQVSIGTFRVIRDILVVDLTRVPKIDIFDPEYGGLYDLAGFLHDFTDSISQPVVKSDRVHVEYIPTQILTEYFRDIHKDVLGIVYPSTQRPGSTSVVIFVDQNGIVGCEDEDGRKSDKILELIQAESREVVLRLG